MNFIFACFAPRLPALLITLCLLFPFILMAPITTHAAQENPKTLQGLWSQPDCAKTDSLLIMSQYFMIYSDKAGLIVDTPFSWQEAIEDGEILYGLQPVSGRPAIFSRSNDGLLRIHQTALTENEPLHRIWDNTDDQTDDEFSHCAKLFDSTPSLGQTEINTIFFLDMMINEPSCAGITAADFQNPRSGPARQCHHFLFTLADQDQDGKLDRQELSRLYSQAAFLDRGLHHCPLPSPSTEQKQAMDFAEDVFRANGKQPLSPADMIAMIDGGTSSRKDHPALNSFLNHVQNLHTIIPFIPAPPDGAAAHACPRQGSMPRSDTDRHGARPELHNLQIQWNAPRIDDKVRDEDMPEPFDE